MSAGARSGYRAVIVATLTLVHQPQAVEALERRLRDEILTANLSRTPVRSADERFIVERVLGHGASSVVCRANIVTVHDFGVINLVPGGVSQSDGVPGQDIEGVDVGALTSMKDRR